MSREGLGIGKRIGDLFVLANSQFVGPSCTSCPQFVGSCFKYLKDLG